MPRAQMPVHRPGLAALITLLLTLAPGPALATVLRAARAGRDRPRRPWMGVASRPVDAKIAESLGMARPRGVLVESADDRAAAAEAGLAPGGVVLAVNGRKTPRIRDLKAALDRPARRWRLRIARGERIITTVLGG